MRGDPQRSLTYDFAYSWQSTYGRAARLIASQAEIGTVLDLGAGVGTLGHAVGRYDFGYLAVDADADNVAAMRARGREAARVDLLADDAVDRILEVVAANTPIVAVTMLDVIEHLPDPERTVRLLRDVVDQLTDRQANTPLVVLSVPNVAHHDLGAKLLLGRWDVTPTGLLDVTHVTFFTASRLDAVMSSGGFTETCRDDVVMDVTEQRGPVDVPVFGSAVLAQYLRAVREAADPNGSTYQFVRSYRRCPDGGAGADQGVAADHEEDPAEGRPFLSVVVRTQGTRMTLFDTLTSLAAQHDRDIEVLLMVHSDDPDTLARIEDEVAAFEDGFCQRIAVRQVRGGGRSRPLNEALTSARGRYLAILDDDDIVTPDWVGTFRRLADRSPGRMVRAGCVVQRIVECGPHGTIDFSVDSGFSADYPGHFDTLDAIRSNRSPPCSYAVPLDAVRVLGVAFDESLRVCEDWRFELQIALVCGAVDAEHVTSVYRRWRSGGGASQDEGAAVWIADHEAVIDALDEIPTLLPAGSLRRIHELYRYVEQLEVELGRRHQDEGPFAASP